MLLVLLLILLVLLLVWLLTFLWEIGTGYGIGNYGSY